MDAEIRQLDLVQDGSHFLPREGRVGQEIEEVFDRPLEVDVVLPERVVGIEDKVLRFHGLEST